MPNKNLITVSGPISSDDLVSYSYTFQVTATFDTTNAENLDLTNYLKNLKISFDLEKHVMPEFHMKFDIPPKDVETLQVYYNRLRLVVTGFAIKNSSNPDRPASEEYIPQISLTPVLITNEFSPIEPSPDETVSGSSERDILQEFEAICVPTDALKWNKNITTGAYNDTTAARAIMGIVSNTSLDLDMMGGYDTRKYSQVILLPNNILINIQQIIDNYGLYPYPTSVFLFGNTIRILPLGIDTDKNRSVPDQHGRININLRNPAKSEQGASRNNASLRYIPSSNPDMENIAIVDNISNTSTLDQPVLNMEMLGNHNEYSSYRLYGGQSIRTHDVEESDDLIDNLIKKTKRYKNIRNNLMNEDQFDQGVVRNNIGIEYRFSNSALSYLDAYKMIDLHVDNSVYEKRYDGTYYMSKGNFMYTKASGSNVMRLTGNIMMRKIVNHVTQYTQYSDMGGVEKLHDDDNKDI